MANWYGSARTNYVRIKDRDGLDEALAPFSLQVWDKEGAVAFGGEDEFGGFPSISLDSEGNEVQFDPETHICPYMEPNQVLIVMEVGAEKLRYLTGWATAYSSEGKSVHVSIGDIYDKAEAAFPNHSITEAEY
jgi:hypothetical protein